MTNREAIDILKSCQPLECGFCIQGGEQVNEALQTAINALRVASTKELLINFVKEEMPESYDKDYFKEAIIYWRENMERFHHKNYTSMLSIWTHVRCLIFTYYGVHSLTQMKEEWKDEANKRAIDILKMVEKGDEDADSN